MACLSDGHVPRARALARQALEQAAAAGQEPVEPLPALAALCEALFDAMCGRYELGLARARAPIERLETLGLADRLAYAHSCIGFAIGKLGDPQAGLAWVERALEAAERLGQFTARIKALNDAGCLHALLHHHELAIRKLTLAATLAQQGAPRLAQTGSMANLACALLLQARNLQQQGLAARATDAAGRALSWADRARRAGEQGSEVASVMLLGVDVFRARALLMLGRCEEASELLRAALQQVQPYRQVQVEALRGLLALCRQQGQVDEARLHLAAALALCDAEGYEPARLEVLEEGVELETELGQPVRALALWLQHFVLVQQQHRARQRVEQPPGGAGATFAAAAPQRWPEARDRAALQEIDGWRDPLTGLLNDRGLETVAQAAFEQGADLAVALLRVDAAAVGAAALVSLGQAAAQAWSRRCLPARAVGGTFVVLCPDQAPERALEVCRQLYTEMSRALQSAAAAHGASAAPGNAQGPATLSAGFAARSRHADLESLMGDAVAALQRAIAQGGNRFEAG